MWFCVALHNHHYSVRSLMDAVCVCLSDDARFVAFVVFRENLLVTAVHKYMYAVRQMLGAADLRLQHMANATTNHSKTCYHKPIAQRVVCVCAGCVRRYWSQKRAPLDTDGNHRRNRGEMSFGFESICFRTPERVCLWLEEA